MGKTPQQIVIGQGMTFSGWSPYLGFVIFLFGLFSTIGAFAVEPLALLFALPITAFGMAVFMKIRGTVIDIPTQRIKIYQHFLLFKAGAWMDLARFDRIIISFHREQFSHSIGATYLDTRAHVRSYFVALHGKENYLLLNECDSHRASLELAEKVSAACSNMPVIDQVKEQRSRRISRKR